MNKNLAWLLLISATGLFLTACTPAPPAGSSLQTGSSKTRTAENKEAAEKPTEADIASVPGHANEHQSGASPAGAPPGSISTAYATSKQSGTSSSGKEADSGRSVHKNGRSQSVKVDELPSDMTILTISGEPVTVGQYRRMYKMQQLQLEALVMNNPQVRAGFTRQAGQMNLSLTGNEKAKLIAAAHKSKGPGEAAFKKFLKENQITQAQFDNEICDIGLAVKAVESTLQQSLLNDLINRELLCRFGKSSGLSGKAMSSYMNFKHSPQYKEVAQATGLSQEGLRDEILKNELSALMIAKIKARAAVSDKELHQLYNKNKSKLKHKERIRLSQIIVAAPSVDAGGVQSVRTQVEKSASKLSGKQLDEKVQQVMDLQRSKANAILTMVRSGKDFASLANQLSDDTAVQKSKNGGDLGYQEKGQLVPELARAVWPLKAGQVYPGLVQTAIGFHIVKVTEHQGPGTASFNEVKAQLKELLLKEKQQQLVNNWLRDKRQTAALVLTPRFASLLSGSENTSMNTTLTR